MEHLFNNWADFEDYTPISTRRGSTTKNGGAFNIIGIGTVRKLTTHGGKTTEVWFMNALHALELSNNLVSLSWMDQQGYKGVFGDGEIIICDPSNTPFMRATLRPDWLYELTLKSLNTLALSARSHSHPTDMATWHRWQGHVGIDSIKWMKTKDLVDGLAVTDSLIRGLCEDCTSGKQTWRPFDEVITPKKDPLQQIHIDLWGPTQVQSVGGKSYILTFTDSGTSHRKIFFLADKQAKTTLEALKQYHALAECQTSRNLKQIQSDEGTEFVNETWNVYLRNYGIIHETTAPYSSAANRVAECANCSIIERTRSMLWDGNLPVMYWAEASATSVYLMDFVPSSWHPDKTPFELWFRQRPDIVHLHPFGCICYAKIPDAQSKGKLSDQLIKCALISYFSRDG